MFRRWWPWVVLIALVLVGTRPAADRVTSENCARITPGMTPAEVYELIGEPTWRGDCGVGVPPGEEPPELWDGTKGHIAVVFDLKRHVIRAHYRPK